MKRTGFKKDILCVGLIFIFAFLFMGKFFFTGRLAIPSDLLNTELPWMSRSADQDYTNSSLFDTLLGVYPFQLHNERMLRQGIVPLWNPYQFSGTPFVANAHSGVFYPISIFIFLAFGTAAGLGINALIHLWLAGMGVFLLARFLRTGRAGAVFSACAFMFCGWFVVRLENKPLIETAAWLPYMFLFYMLAVKRGRMRYIFPAALALGLQFLTGMLQMAIYSAGVLGLWVIFSIAADLVSGKFKVHLAAFKIGALAIVGVFGTLIAAVQLMPSFELLQLSARTTMFAGTAATVAASSFSKVISPFVIMFMPEFYGTPILKNNWSNLSVMGLTVYCGIATLLLGLIAVRFRRNRHNVFFFLLAILSLLLSSGSVAYEIVIKIFPMLSIFLIERFSLYFMFAFAILGGAGLDALLRDRIPFAKMAKTALASAAALAALAAVLIWLNTFYWPQLSTPQIFWAHEHVQILRFAVFMAASVVAVVLGARLGPRWTVALCFAVLLTDLPAWGVRFPTATSPDMLFPPSQLAGTIKSDTSEPFRIHAFTTPHIFIPDTATALELQDVRGYDSMYFARYSDVIRTFQELHEKGSFVPERWLNFTAYNQTLLKLLNIKYVMTVIPVHKQRPEFELIGRIENVYLYKYRYFTPRAYLVNTFIEASAKHSALELMTTSAFDPAKMVVLEDKLVWHGSETPPRDDKHWVRFETAPPLETRLTVNTPRRAFLVLSEVDYPGWRMTINGAPADFIRANHAFRAVPLEAGFYNIRFYFSPDSVRKGYAASLAALILILIFTPLLFIEKPTAA